MKKRIMLVLAVLMLAAPAWAEVLITCECDGNDVTVHFDARSEPNLVRGFALDMLVSHGATITDFVVDSFFDIDYSIYPGSIDINNVTGLVDSNGSPIGDPCVYPGTLPGLNSAGVTVEFGSLYEKGIDTPPDPCGDMFTFTVSDECLITIGENIVRAGVVVENPNLDPDVNSPGCFVGCMVPNVLGKTEAAADANLIAAGFTIGTVYLNENSTQPVGTVVAVEPVAGSLGCGTAVKKWVSGGDCMVATHPDYTMWVGAAYGWSKPDCWCDDRQQRGNADQQWQGPFPVGTWDLDMFRDALSQHFATFTGVNAKRICADFNHTWQGPFPVGTYDLNVFRKYLSDHFAGVPVTSGPGCQNVYNGLRPEGDPLHLTDPNSFRPCDPNAFPNSEIVFWDAKGGD